MTERDEYVTALALAFGIEVMNLQAAEARNTADQDDMRRILASLVPTDKSRKALLGAVRMTLASLDEVED